MLRHTNLIDEDSLSSDTIEDTTLMMSATNAYLAQLDLNLTIQEKEVLALYNSYYIDHIIRVIHASPQASLSASGSGAFDTLEEGEFTSLSSQLNPTSDNISGGTLSDDEDSSNSAQSESTSSTPPTHAQTAGASTYRLRMFTTSRRIRNRDNRYHPYQTVATTNTPRLR